jgi:hypothetical protein
MKCQIGISFNRDARAVMTIGALIGAIAANFSGDQSARIDRSSLQKIDRTWVSQINSTD